MFTGIRWLAVSAAVFFLICGSAIALDSDQEQPATLEANDFELDLKTGVRTYRGNVVYRQGSIRLDCDELVTYFNDDGALDKAICNGDPGKFKQRPEGSEDDMIGKAREITMDQIEQLVVMRSHADVVQGRNRLTGRLITYDLETEKVRVKGDKNKPTKSTTAADSGTATKDSSEVNADGSKSGEESSNDVPSRPTLIIQPRKKKTQKSDDS